MGFYCSLKRTTHAFLSLFPLAVVVGAVFAVRHLLANRYLEYGMLRLAALSFQENLNLWILVLAAICTASLLIISLIRILAIVIPIDMIEIRIRKKRAMKATISLSLGALVFIWGGWVVNHYWLPDKLHPASIMADTVLLLLLMATGYFVVDHKLNTSLVLSRVKVLSKISPPLMIVVLLLNIALFVDGGLNAPTQPNTVLIVIDSLRADHLGCYGYDRDTSPAIDDLSRQSLFFRSAISSAPWTSPSVASMVTSQYPAVLGFEGTPPIPIDSRYVTLAEVFRENNYVTKGIVANTCVSSSLGFDQGFDSYDEDNAAGHGHVSSPSLLRKATAFLDGHGDEKFFLYVHYFDPHYDYIQHEDYNYYPDYEGCLYSSQTIEELRKGTLCIGESDLEYLEALYDSEIRFTDESIGGLVDVLKELDLYDNTLIVLTADHGEEFLDREDHWIGHTKKLYREQLHVPLLVKLPWSDEGKVVEDDYDLIGLMPAILGFIGLDIPAAYEYEGHAFSPDERTTPDARPIISETNRWARLRSVTWRDWKYIYNVETKTKELYDLGVDPAERENVALRN